VAPFDLRQLTVPLRPLSDVSAAEWFIDSDADWWTKVCLGPPGFEAYARVHFDMQGEVRDTVVVTQVLEVLARHTKTADDVYVGVWKGWGFWPENHHPDATQESDFIIDNRDYQLFGGHLADAVDWRSLGLDHESGGAVPHLIWPSDHAWFVAADVDPDWIGVGGTQALFDELVGDARLDVAPTTYDATEWEDR
jgi:hypothetical protein